MFTWAVQFLMQLQLYNFNTYVTIRTDFPDVCGSVHTVEEWNARCIKQYESQMQVELEQSVFETLG